MRILHLVVPNSSPPWCYRPGERQQRGLFPCTAPRNASLLCCRRIGRSSSPIWLRNIITRPSTLVQICAHGRHLLSKRSTDQCPRSGQCALACIRHAFGNTLFCRMRHRIERATHLVHPSPHSHALASGKAEDCEQVEKAEQGGVGWCEVGVWQGLGLGLGLEKGVGVGSVRGKGGCRGRGRKNKNGRGSGATVRKRVRSC